MIDLDTRLGSANATPGVQLVPNMNAVSYLISENGGSNLWMDGTTSTFSGGLFVNAGTLRFGNPGAASTTDDPPAAPATTADATNTDQNLVRNMCDTFLTPLDSRAPTPSQITRTVRRP